MLFDLVPSCQVSRFQRPRKREGGGVNNSLLQHKLTLLQLLKCCRYYFRTWSVSNFLPSYCKYHVTSASFLTSPEVLKTITTRLKLNFHLACHVTSRHDLTCRAHAFWLRRACRTARLDTLVSTRSKHRTCRVVSRRDVTSQVEFGLQLRFSHHRALMHSTKLRTLLRWHVGTLCYIGLISTTTSNNQKMSSFQIQNRLSYAPKLGSKRATASGVK